MGKTIPLLKRVFIKFTKHEWHFPFSCDLNNGVKGRLELRLGQNMRV